MEIKLQIKQIFQAATKLNHVIKFKLKEDIEKIRESMKNVCQ